MALDRETQFKAAFLRSCIDQGMTVDEIEAKANAVACTLEKQATVLGSLATASSAALAGAAALPIGAGMLGGWGLARMQRDPGVVDDAKAEEVASEYDRQAGRLKRRRYYAEANVAGAQNRFLADQAARRQQYMTGLEEHNSRLGRLTDLERRHATLANRTDLAPEDLSSVQALENELRSHRQGLAPPEPPAVLQVPGQAADPMSDLEHRLSAVEGRLSSGPLGRAVSSLRRRRPAAPKRVEIFG